MHDVTLEGPLSQKSNAQSQLQEILSNHQSLLEHNVLLLHKSECSLVTKDHQAEGSFSTVPGRVLVWQSDKESTSLRLGQHILPMVNSSIHLWTPDFGSQQTVGLD